MASSIKGITIKVGGETTELQKALKDVNSQVYTLNADLKNLNQALKLDPKNTELLAQKQEVLQRAIGEAAKKLETLKEAQRQMGDYNKLTDQQKSSYNALSKEIAKTEDSLNKMNKELKETSKIDLSKVKDGLKKVGEVAATATKELLKVSAAVGTALAGVVAAGVKSYAQLEQNLGGIETLFKEDADLVIENAKRAAKEAGVSANEYMSGVASFSASLLQSLGGDTKKAADVADMAFKDMSDNANKFGTDMSSIQNAYQGFAKQNYTMLDNLKLGYGGTKTEMQRLLKDAEKFSGIKYDINNLSDVYQAIHVIQEEMGITGTTAEEAATTISGSFGTLKAELDNFLNGTGSPEALSQAVINTLTNIANAIQTLAPNILNGVVSLVETLLPQVASIIMNLLPQLMDAVSRLIDNLLNGVKNNTDGIKTTISELVKKVVQFITENLPKIVELAILIVETLAEALIENLPMIVQSAIDMLLSIIDTITSHLDKIIILAIDIILTLATALIDAIPKLVEKLPQIIISIVEALTSPEMIMKLISVAPTMMLAIAKALIESIPTLLTAVPEIIGQLLEDFITWVQETDFIQVGKDIIQAIIDGILSLVDEVKNAAGKVVDKIKGVFTGSTDDAESWGKDMTSGLAKGIKTGTSAVLTATGALGWGIKKLLHFSRPDEGPLREYEVWMPDFMEGLAKGIKDNSYMVYGAMGNLATGMAKTFDIDSVSSEINAAMGAINTGIETSLNPTINPNITIDTNYKMMALAMKEALKDMEVELDDREVGQFVIKTVEQEVYS